MDPFVTTISVILIFLSLSTNIKCCMTKDEFKDKVVIVTGSSSGIGEATALYFAAQSAIVVVTGRNKVNLMKVANTVEKIKGIKPLVVKADITIDEELETIINKTLQQFGRIDVLVNNAGAGVIGKLRDGINIFDEMIKTNLRSAYLLTSLAAPHLIKTRGNIINVSSINSLRPIPDGLAYSVSKAGLDAFTKGVAIELSEYGVRVNSVNPGIVSTNFLIAAGLNVEQSENTLELATKNSPLGYISTPENIADLIGFLASDRAKCITGGTYVIDNGKLLE